MHAHRLRASRSCPFSALSLSSFSLASSSVVFPEHPLCLCFLFLPSMHSASHVRRCLLLNPHPSSLFAGAGTWSCV